MPLTGSELIAARPIVIRWLLSHFDLQLADAEDAAQAAILAALEKPPAFRTRVAVSSWLISVARRVHLHKLRCRRNNTEATRPLPATLTVDERATVQLVSRTIAEAITADEESSLLRMTYWEDLTQLEIRSNTGLSRDVLQYRITRARKRLRSKLNGLQYVPLGPPSSPSLDFMRIGRRWEPQHYEARKKYLAGLTGEQKHGMVQAALDARKTLGATHG